MKKTVAVIGASKDRSKFGNKAVRAYVKDGWTVYPVNPNEEEVEGLRCYSSIAEVPQPLERVSMYVPWEVGSSLLPEIAEANPVEVFFNPGSEDEKSYDIAKGLGLNAIFACSIVDIGEDPSLFGERSEKE